MLVRAGVELLTEKGFSATRVDDVLNATGISKGSFYACFDSKQAFGRVLIEHYASYFNARIDRCLADGARPPLRRLLDFVHDARDGMQRHAFRRGCLIGNLGHEIDILPESFNTLLCAILRGWERRVTECLLEVYGAAPSAAQRQLCAGFHVISGSGGKGPYCARGWNTAPRRSICSRPSFSCRRRTCWEWPHPTWPALSRPYRPDRLRA